MKLEQYTRLKKAVEERRRLVDRNTGRKEQLLQRLEKEFGCKTLEEGSAKLEQMKQELASQQKKLDLEAEKLQKEFDNGNGS